MEDQVNVNQAAQPNPLHEGSVGPVIGGIIILAVIVLGGLYFWNERADNAQGEDADTEEEVREISEQSSSDDAASIEADLEATDVDGLDAELDAS